MLGAIAAFFDRFAGSGLMGTLSFSMGPETKQHWCRAGLRRRGCLLCLCSLQPIQQVLRVPGNWPGLGNMRVQAGFGKFRGVELSNIVVKAEGSPLLTYTNGRCVGCSMMHIYV